MDMSSIKKVHLIGIGGIGISALAKLMLHEGKVVQGTNEAKSPQTLHELEQKGVRISYAIDIKNVDPDTDLIVYSDAWPAREPEFMEAVRALGIPTHSYFEVLGFVTKGKTTIAVGGTHGKTTTTGFLAKALIDAGLNPTVIVGSVMKDFGSNFVPGGNTFVVEACEYQDHILKLHPKFLIITNIELDHTDYFPDLSAIQATFRQAAIRLPEDGALITNPHDPNIAPILEGLSCRVIDYSTVSVPELQLIGGFNIQNARAAKAAAQTYASDVSEELIDESLEGFGGTWRRFEYKGRTALGADVYDDYAHHPTAIRETIRAAKEKLAGKKLLVAFHPHLYSRTKSLFREFVEAFDEVDEVILAPIFAAREKPDPSVSSDVLAQEITKRGIPATSYESLEEVQAVLETVPAGTVIITMGAGDIYKVADQIAS